MLHGLASTSVFAYLNSEFTVGYGIRFYQRQRLEFYHTQEWSHNIKVSRQFCLGLGHGRIDCSKADLDVSCGKFKARATTVL